MEFFHVWETWGVIALDWVRENPGWLLLALCFFAFTESLAFMGILVPGIVILGGLGTIAASSGVSIWSTMGLIYAGAVLGDGISYYIGYLMRYRVYQLQFFRNRPQWLPMAARVFKKFGIPALAFGRFIGPLRPVLPITAGVLALSPRLFYSLNLLTGMAWAAVLTFPAYKLSDFLQAGEWHLALWLMGGIFLMVGIAVALAVRLRRL